MVQAADPGEHTPESEVAFGGKGKLVETLGLTVKMELEDSLEEEYGPTNKRSKQVPECIQFYVPVIFIFQFALLPFLGRVAFRGR